MWPMEYAIVSTVRPKASETPNKPIPTCGNPAAMTAEPQPANVSQNVPIASATYFLIWSIGCFSLFAQGGAKTNLNTVDPNSSFLGSGSGLFNALSERGGASGAVKDVFALSERRP